MLQYAAIQESGMAGNTIMQRELMPSHIFTHNSPHSQNTVIAGSEMSGGITV